MQKQFSGVLIIDDDERLLKAFCRCAKGRFDGLLYPASTPKQAFDELKRLDSSISHIVCDWDLGSNSIKGDRLLSAIRESYPDIVRGVIWTGSIERVKPFPGVDAVISKGENIDSLFDVLGV